MQWERENCVFAGDIILYIKTLKDSISSSCPKPVNKFNKLAVYKINTQHSVQFLSNNEHSKKYSKKIKNTMSLIIVTRTIKTYVHI